jgi:hypothetical protein
MNTALAITDTFTNDLTKFEQLEEHVVLNPNFSEINGSIKDNNSNETLILPIPSNGIISHSAIRQILNDKIITNIKFEDKNKFITYRVGEQLIILFEFSSDETAKTRALTYFNVFTQIK